MIKPFKNSLIAVLVLLFAFVAVVPIHAQEQQIPTQEQYLRDQYEFLKSEAIRFEERVNRERGAFISNVQLELAVLVAILSILGVGGFLTIKDRADKAFDKHIEKNGRELQRRAEKWSREVVKGEFGLNKHIVLLADKKRHKQILTNEEKLLQSRGFNKVSLRSPKGKVDDADLVVFCYKDDLDKTLTKLVEALEAENRGKPLIVYYKGNVSNQKVRQYQWHVYANTPLTLVSWVFTVLSSYQGSIKEGNHVS